MGEAANQLQATDEPVEVEERLERSLKDVSRTENLTHNVLSLVVHNSYDHAEREIEVYFDLKNEYPTFAATCDRYVSHCRDLIHAIRTKRSMPGLEFLSISKRQEIYDSVLHHFNELKETLKRIEKTEYSMRIADLRSTIIVVKTFVWCVLALVVLSFIMDVHHGLYSTTGSVFEDLINRGVNWAFDRLGL